MKIFISLEPYGLTGIIKSNISDLFLPSIQELILNDIIAVIESSYEEGASEIIINDAKEIITPSSLKSIPQGVKIIKGKHKIFYMMEGFDADFDAVLMLGYRARTNTPFAFSPYSFSDKIISIKINNKEVGAFFINSLFAGYFNTPVIFALGDSGLEKEIREYSNDIEVAVVKYGLASSSVVLLSPQDSYNIIRKKCSSAFRKKEMIKPIFVPPPYNLEIRFANQLWADLSMRLPNIERTAPDVVVYREKDYINVYKILLSIFSMLKIIQ